MRARTFTLWVLVIYEMVTGKRRDDREGEAGAGALGVGGETMPGGGSGRALAIGA